MIIESKDNRGMLLHLALHGPSIGNRIDTISNASRVSRHLEDRGVIETKYGLYEEYDRGVNLLWLTTKGLIVTFSIMNPMDLDIHRVAKHWEQLLPDVFGFLPAFGDTGTTEVMRGTLLSEAYKYVNSWSFGQDEGNYEGKFSWLFWHRISKLVLNALRRMRGLDARTDEYEKFNAEAERAKLVTPFADYMSKQLEELQTTTGQEQFIRILNMGSSFLQYDLKIQNLPNLLANEAIKKKIQSTVEKNLERLSTEEERYSWFHNYIQKLQEKE